MNYKNYINLKSLCRQALCLCGGIFLWAGIVFSQQDTLEPLNTVINFTKSESLEELNTFLCCKALESGNFKLKDLDEFRDSSIVYSQLYNKGSGALVAANMHYQKEDTINIEVYFFLTKMSESWKIEDFGIQFLTTPEQVDRQFSSYLTLGEEIPGSRDRINNFLRYIEGLKLSASTEEQIEKYFLDNKERFINILPAVDSIAGKNLMDPDDDSVLVSRPWLREILISRVYRGVYSLMGKQEYNYPGVTFLEIGRAYGVAVGYMHLEGNASIPDDKKFIYIKELAPGWYLYRVLLDLG